MGTSDTINVFVAIGTIGAVVVAMVGIWLNGRQSRKDWKHSQQLATEERQHQSRPIVVPVGAIAPTSLGSPYTGALIDWNYQGELKLGLQNMGGGPALNIHCILYGSEPIHMSQFVSWDNGPLGKDLADVLIEHPEQLWLNPDDTVDGSHPLYDAPLPSSTHSTEGQIARLTITYHDIFGNKHVSIFNYTLEHHWTSVSIGIIPSHNKKPPVDLKELNAQKRQQSPKLSAPPVKTS